MKTLRTKLEKRESIQATLERCRRFDYDYIPFGDKWVMPTDKYPYRQKFFGKIAQGFLRTVMCILGPVLLKVVYGAKVTGKKNRRAIKGQGAISVCNHFSYLDTLMIRQAIGHMKSYHTMGPRNNKKGFGGAFLRHGGMWAFSSNLAAMRALHSEMELRLNAGSIVNFYAEQAMWVNYQKPRPMLDGAFFYAVKYRVPVLPVFCTFHKNRKGHIKRLRINILPAVYADETLKKSERIADIKRRAEAEWQKCYEEYYGVKLAYLEKKSGDKQ